MTRQDIADALGIDRASLYNKLSGKTEFSLSEAVALAKVLGCKTVDELITSPFDRD